MWTVHVHSLAARRAFPDPQDYGRIAKAVLLSRGMSSAPEDEEWKTHERFRDDDGLFVFPNPVLVHGGLSRSETKSVAVSALMEREGLLAALPKEQAAMIKDSAEQDAGVAAGWHPYVHYVELACFNKEDFLAWLEPANAQTGDFICTVFGQAEDEKEDSSKSRSRSSSRAKETRAREPKSKSKPKSKPKGKLVPPFAGPLVCVHQTDSLEADALDRVVREHVSKCLRQDQHGMPRPTARDNAARAGFNGDVEAMVRFFRDEQAMLGTLFPRDVARLFHPFFQQAKFADGAVCFSSKDVDARRDFGKSATRDLLELARDPGFRPKSDKLQDFLDLKTSALRAQNLALFGADADAAWVGLPGFTLSEKAAALLRPPKPEVFLPRQDALTQYMANFVSAHVARLCCWLEKHAGSQHWPRALKLRLEGLVRDYVNDSYFPARQAVASAGDDSWRKAYRVRDDVVFVLTHGEQRLVLDHLANVTGLPMHHVAAVLPCVHDPDFEHYEE
jgi:hypothetical protein